MTENIYLLGRKQIKIASFLNKSSMKGCAFISDLPQDRSTIAECTFEHCTFANIGFKESKIHNSKFTNCVFIGCYFRKSDLTEVSFMGCRFIDCQFPRIIIKCCSFDYCLFTNCFIPFHEIEYSLPGAPNLREELARNMSVESAKLGFFDESNRYRKEELRSREKNLLAAFKGETDWYKRHYDCCRQIKALFKYSVSMLNGFFFGYGQYFWPLMRNLFISILFFWGLFFSFKENLIVNGADKKPDGWDALIYSLHNILPSGIDVKIEAGNWLTRGLAGIESLWGIILAAYVASYIFRWSLNK